MSKDLKPAVYYLLRRGWYGQASQACESAMSKKGKEPVALYWHAFAIGMSGSSADALRELDSFQSRRDLHFAMNVALLYFHRRASSVDKEAVNALKSELSIAEDVAKEPGLVLAARFQLFTGNYSEARRIAKKFAGNGLGGNTGASVFEVESFLIEQWSNVEEIAATWENSADQRRQLSSIDNLFRNNRSVELQDPDALMLLARVKFLLGGPDGEVLNILNQTISLHPTFFYSLADKALLLASINDWDQALDSAQRVLDADQDNLDALKIIAVHSFTQESQPHDAIQKLEDLDRAIKAREPYGVRLAIETASLFSKVCSRQPRALQICARLLERATKNSANGEEEAQVRCELGHIYIMQGSGSYEKAMKELREATKRDPQNVKVLLGLILGQIVDGQIEDAESQIELLGLMHNLEDLGFELVYYQALIAKLTQRTAATGEGNNPATAKQTHLALLEKCKELFLQANDPMNNISFHASQLLFGLTTKKPYLDAFQNLTSVDPEFSMLLSLDFFSHTEYSGSTSMIPSTNALLNMGGEEDGGSQKFSSNALLTTSSSTRSAGGSNGSGVDDGSGAMEEIGYTMKCGLELLQRILQLCPGMIVGYVELARAYFVIGRYEEATRTLQQALSMQPQSAPLLLAMAHVECGRLKTSVADRLLEQALATDFSIRSVPKFRLIKAIVRAQQGKFSEALKEIEQVLSLPEFGFNPSGGENDPAMLQMLKSGALAAPSTSSSSYSDAMRLTDNDRVSVFVSYAAILSRERRMKEANKVLSHAKVMFAGTSQEVQVLVAASQLYVEKGDFDAAIRMLDKISPDSSSYKRAQMVKADIILNHNHDREGFTKCFENLVETDPNSSHSLVLLGDAYLRILNPESAIDALERAYKLDPTNSRLRGKIGRALIATHEYHRALEFYESALREVARTTKTSEGGSLLDTLHLSHDLAKLYVKLRRIESAGRVLKDALHNSRGDVTMMRQDVSTLLLLAKFQEIHAPHEVFDTIQQAYSIQKEVLTKLRTSGALAAAMTELMNDEKNILSDLAMKLGVVYLTDEKLPEAEQILQEAIQFNGQNTSAMYHLAKVLFAKKDYDQCLVQCNKITTANSKDRDAAILTSEVYLQKTDETGEILIDKSCDALTAYMKNVPNDYLGLERTIMILRRGGRLQEAQLFLVNAEKTDRRSVGHAGYHYCQGLYARFTNDIGKAIFEFNYARKDDLWGANALTHMIELYLNPDQDGIWEEKETGPVDDATRANIAAAEELLKELRPIAKDELRVRILESYSALATRNKVSVDRAMQNFVEMLDNDQDYLPAVLGMATGFMIEKNQHKARNLLKRVGRMEMNKHDGEDFEKSNLLLAKFYIDKAKNDLAQEMCKKTLVQNKSCSQAWEILGLIFEKESNYEMASDAYKKAWVLEFEASAPVGFKLAFSYLKCKKFVDAIDVCEQVLRLYPDYPRISDEILNKALQSLRTNNTV